ncbi:MAG: hypothetical protein HN921_16950 [Bacteroidetes bacterium]|jgi:hypothetical protein|nr:hypothetical protein [Cytophagia bacterium]MBT5990515.1 hypothetical protein [Bacteroidota bacterium]MBT7041520.1 hypothetical protein [Bacteroidota bacterium]MBT7827164.1 hypothetical protein [Bacteroidota bacterium]
MRIKHFHIVIAFLPFFNLLNVACKKEKTECVYNNQLETEELVFHSGYEGSSNGIPNDAHEKIKGIDQTFPNKSDWQKSFNEHPIIGNFKFWYEDGKPSQRYAKIIADPTASGNKVLHFWLNESSINYKVIKKKGRIQANIVNNNKLRSIYIKQRLYVHSDFEQLKTYPKKITWMTIQEFWNNASGKEFPFRVTLNIRKTITDAGDLYFGSHAQIKENGKWNNIWGSVNESYKLPIGQWITIETYVIEGGENNGRFVFEITDSLGNKETIFDITGYTQHPEDPCPNGFNRFNPMKLYTSEEIISFMNQNDKTLQLYWDDFELWVNKKP